MVYHLSMFYLIWNEASYQSFWRKSLWLGMFLQQSALIKVALEVCSDGAIISTDFTVPKICFVPYEVNIFQLRINSDICG